jgi:hypothetical protein
MRSRSAVTAGRASLITLDLSNSPASISSIRLVLGHGVGRCYDDGTPTDSSAMTVEPEARRSEPRPL